MRRGLRSLGVSVLLSAGVLASVPGQPVSAGHQSGPYFDLGALKPPDYTGKQIYDGLKDFVADFPLRITGTPNEIAAGQALHTEMQGLGYATVTRSLAPAGGVGVDNAQGVGAGLKAVIATKPGTTMPDEWIMFIGHYDAVPQTTDGAYDNGAGTNFIRFLAHEFKDVTTNRSLVFVFYNGEEQGILASARHASELQAAGQKVAGVLGFDMVGIAWPVKNEGSQNCLCIWRGAADAAKFSPLIDHVNFEFLGFPNALTKVRNAGQNNRNSDESAFASRGFPTLRWAGMRTASSYNGYHNQNDTIANIDAVAGLDESGTSFYEVGIENTLKSVYYTALALDNHLPKPALGAIVRNGLTVSLDGSQSTDPDGAVTDISWDFGDGATATGATADHTFTQAGTYTVTLTVADNLHPQVTRSAEYQVTVG